MQKAKTPHQSFVYVDIPVVSLWNMNKRLNFTDHKVDQKKIWIHKISLSTVTISVSIVV